MDKLEIAPFTSKSTMMVQGGTYQVSFLCDLCDNGYITRPLSAGSAQEALEQARQEARQYFNRCHRCHLWVCDAHYNEDLMMCTLCAPRPDAREGKCNGSL